MKKSRKAIPFQPFPAGYFDKYLPLVFFPDFGVSSCGLRVARLRPLGRGPRAYCRFDVRPLGKPPKYESYPLTDFMGIRRTMTMPRLRDLAEFEYKAFDPMAEAVPCPEVISFYLNNMPKTARALYRDRLEQAKLPPLPEYFETNGKIELREEERRLKWEEQQRFNTEIGIGAGE